ncbi:MAG: hypothetical protein FWH40_07595 [Coriobacteriia bacterium]|nr:hypothetical protein [Coriobacteriia bacterium]
MSDNLKITDGVVDAAYLLNQVAEHVDFTLADLEAYEAKIRANPWQDESKEAFLSIVQCTKELHAQIRDISLEIIDASVAMLTDFDAAMETVESIAGLSSLY